MERNTVDSICGRLPGEQRRAERGGREASGAGHGAGVVAAVVDAVEALQLHVSVSTCWRLLLCLRTYHMSLMSHVWPYVSLSSFTFSAPLAAKYCPHQQCLHCSEPFEWDPHPYQPCRSLVPLADNATNGNMINSTRTDTVKIEVASPHLAFHGLLFCFTAPQVNLTQDTVKVDLIKEGG